MKYFLCLFLLTFALSFTARSQSTPDTTQLLTIDSLQVLTDTEFLKKIEDLNIIADKRITSLLEIHREECMRKNGTSGFRVEIFSNSTSNARQMAFNVKSDFLSKFPNTNLNVHVKYFAPDFKVRVGDFRTRSEALKFLNTIKTSFPFGFVTKDDNIEFPDLDYTSIETDSINNQSSNE